MGNSASFELQIQQSLKNNEAADSIVQTLIEQSSNQELNLDELQTISRFCLSTGQLKPLVTFLADRATQQKRIPWDYFVEALCQASAAIPENLKAAIMKGVDSQDALFELMSVHHLDYYDERIAALRNRRGEEGKLRAEKLRAQLLSELELMKNQKLIEPQIAHLQKMDRLFPDDVEVQDLVDIHEEQNILELLKQRPSRGYQPPLNLDEPIDSEIEKAWRSIDSSMEDLLAKNPELALDFSISHLMWENHRSALRFLEKAPETAARGWLKAHLLLASRRFVDLLNELPAIELTDHQNPAAALEATYFRAQAHWGLGDKTTALELMESLLEQRPDYRAGSSILAQWKDSLI